MVLYRFPKKYRLHRRNDIRRVFQRRCSVRDARLRILGCENDCGDTRMAAVVSRKYGKAVRRNRLRRLYREAFRLTRHELPAGLDLILMPNSQDEPALHELQSSLRALVPALKKKLERRPPKRDDSHARDGH